LRQRTFSWLSKWLKCRDEYYTELNGMPTGVSLFVLLPEERAKWVEYAGQAGPRDPQSGQGPKTVKAGTRTLYRRKDVEQWLAEVDRRVRTHGRQEECPV
jgi:hypothetical protein